MANDNTSDKPTIDLSILTPVGRQKYLANRRHIVRRTETVKSFDEFANAMTKVCCSRCHNEIKQTDELTQFLSITYLTNNNATSNYVENFHKNCSKLPLL